MSASQITPQTPKWAWKDRVPLGSLTVLAGPPGQGKTQLMLGMCSNATRGTLAGDLPHPVDVLYVSAEDSISHTLTPRAIAAKADLARFHFVQGVNTERHNGEEKRPGIEIPKDVALIDQWLSEHDTGIVVLDPIVALIPTTMNTHRDQDVRRALSPLAHMAEARGVAIVVVMHLNKNQEADALNRLSGSIGFGGAARSVLLFASNPDDPQGEAGDQRILAHVKCNVGPKQPSLGYRIEPRVLQTSNGEVKTSIAIRDGDVKASATDLLAKPTSAGEATAREEAKDFLLAELSVGSVASAELKARAEDAGINWRTVERAKSQLNIRARKNGTTWAWELPDTPATPPVGLVVLDGLEARKTDNTDNTDPKGSLADINSTQERAEQLFARHHTAAAA